jgi:type IV secretory pathway VirD2 relaxase
MSADDDLPIFRPKFGKRTQARSATTFPSFRSAVLARGGGRRHSKGAGAARMRVLVHASTNSSRRVLIKAHVQRMGAGSAKAAALHVRYIERDGVEKDGSRGSLYNADGPARAAEFEAPRLREKHQFRLIVSPEDAHELDLTGYVRGLMAQVQRDLGRRLEWGAVNHYDTDHPHAHVIIRGVDLDGREVRIDRAYISNGLRWRAQELATEELGPRPKYDLARQRAREISQDRFTSIDRDIEKRVVGHQIEVRKGRGGASHHESLIIGRLEHLRALGLADKQSGTVWSLDPSWRAHLQDLGMRGDIMKQMHRALRGDPGRYRVLDEQAPVAPESTNAPPLRGRVVEKGLADEQRGTFYAIVETPSGEGVYMPLDRRSAETVRAGDFVAVTRERLSWRRAEDTEIQRILQLSQAKNAPSREAPPTHERIVQHLFKVDRPQPLPHSNVVSEGIDARALEDRLRRRLAQLEKVGLASQAADGKWNITPDFIEQLDARDASMPRYRLRIDPSTLGLKEQVVHQGPVWLDAVQRDGLAPYGLGAELQSALAQRNAILRANGIDAASPEKDIALRELERRALAVRIASESGQQFLDRAPDRFRGVVQVHERTTSRNAAYVEISDGHRFILLSNARELESLRGQTVAISYDREGRLRVRPRDLDRGRS